MILKIERKKTYADIIMDLDEKTGVFPRIEDEIKTSMIKLYPSSAIRFFLQCNVP